VVLKTTKWHNNRPVHLLSTFAGVDLTNTVKRWSSAEKTIISVICLSVVFVYNKNMEGVDLLDSLLALYRIRFRSKKWYNKILF
ncbi:hypothetical protein HPB47_023657, partial [Ixodes persulcatus]